MPINASHIYGKNVRNVVAIRGDAVNADITLNHVGGENVKGEVLYIEGLAPPKPQRERILTSIATAIGSGVASAVTRKVLGD